MFRNLVYVCLLIPIFSQVVPAQKIENKKAEENRVYAIEVINEINGIRQNPGKYKKYLDEYLELMRGNVIYLPKRRPFRLFEGTTAINEASAFLSNSSKLLPLMRSEILELAAEAHLSELLENPKIGHFGKNGEDLETRLNKFGRRTGTAGECIAFSDKTPRQVALTMIIDDGVESRMHRKIVVNPEFLIAGTACGQTKEGRYICVAIFARQMLPLESLKPVPIEIN